MSHELFLWAIFTVLIVACLAVDLGLGRHRHGRISLRAAAVWSLVWILAAGLFAVFVWHYRGPKDALDFVTGYLVEKALSVDNMFVFIMIFAYFAVADEDQPRVLKWGILGAVVFRGSLIAAADVIVKRFDWVLYVFAAMLVWAAYKMLTHSDEEIHPEKNPVLAFSRRVFPIVNRYEGHHFFVREKGRLHGTALLVVLIVVESTDIVFALDSIPAIFAITKDFFVVFTSNIFAILGLRALFFVLAGIMDMFRFLKIGVAAILFFIAGKMFIHHAVEIESWLSLAIIGAILATSILGSIFISPRKKPQPAPAADDSGGGAAHEEAARGHAEKPREPFIR
jgi:tellurite resistance protein TerC